MMVMMMNMKKKEERVVDEFMYHFLKMYIIKKEL